MQLAKFLLALVVLTVACGDEETATFEDNQTLLAALDNESVLMGVEINDGEITGYVCGDEARFQTFSRWYSGTLTDPDSFRVEADGWALEGRIEDDNRIITMIDPNGVELTGTLNVLGAGETGGVFENNDFDCRSGAIAMPLNGAVQVQGALCSQPGVFATQITPVRAFSGVVESFEAQAAGVDDPFLMERVR